MIEHRRITTGLTYNALVAAFEDELGHLDPKLTEDLVSRKASWDEVKRAINHIGRTYQWASTIFPVPLRGRSAARSTPQRVTQPVPCDTARRNL